MLYGIGVSPVLCELIKLDERSCLEAINCDDFARVSGLLAKSHHNDGQTSYNLLRADSDLNLFYMKTAVI